MKAILIVDVPDDFNLDGAYSNCIIFEGGKHRMWNRIAYLKPMPDFRDEHYKSFSLELSQIINSENRGFNDCIDEILGEYDED